MAVVCVFLNCTTRRVAEPIVKEFFRRYPNKQAYISTYESNKDEIISLIASLGFKNRRAERLYSFSRSFHTDVRHLSDCLGIGEYAEAYDRMYFWEEFSSCPPKDGVLANVWKWVTNDEFKNI